MTQAVVYIEIDLPRCALIYGTAPCTAGVGVTGDHKCFNSLASCQDRENFSDEPATYRFAREAAYLPPDIEAIENLVDVSLTPSTISLGENLGERASVVASFKDHRWPDTTEGFDKYFAERDYDPAQQGTFWGKFRARHPYVRGRPFRVIRGFVGQTLEEMETRHYVIESFDGPDAQGRYTLSAHDVLKLAGNDRAQAPAPNTGTLVGAIDDNDLSATLTPSGVGNDEYAASGWLNLGNKEIVSFTRSGDTLTITRGQLGTVAVAHDAGEFVQTVLRYSGEDPADIIADLFENYAGVPSSWIPLAAWQAETDAYLGRLYTATIPVPMGVEQLVANLVEQMAGAIWTDEVAKLIRLRVLRAIAADATTFSPDNFVEGSLSIQEQPDKRVSQVQVFYGQQNPLLDVTEASNYSNRHIDVDLQSEADYGSAAIRIIYAYWIPAAATSTAERLATLIKGAYVNPPRRFAWSVMKYGADTVEQGGVYQLSSPFMQDETGAEAPAPTLVTRINSGDAFIQAEAEESLWTTFDPEDFQNRSIVVDSNRYNVDALDYHDSVFPELTDDDVANGVTLTITIQPGVTIGSLSTGDPAFRVPAGWPSGFVPSIVNLGRIQGAGARGGNGGSGTGAAGDGTDGGDGGVALLVESAIDLTNDAGEIIGGAGGGGGGAAVGATGGIQGLGGGGGAGTNPGQPGTGSVGVFGGITFHVATAGTADAKGESGFITGQPPSTVGDGGGPGQDGEDGNDNAGAGFDGGAGGAAGAAIDGDSLVTMTGADGDIRGDRIN